MLALRIPPVENSLTPPSLHKKTHSSGETTSRIPRWPSLTLTVSVAGNAPVTSSPDHQASMEKEVCYQLVLIKANSEIAGSWQQPLLLLRSQIEFIESLMDKNLTVLMVPSKSLFTTRVYQPRSPLMIIFQSSNGVEATDLSILMFLEMVLGGFLFWRKPTPK